MKKFTTILAIGFLFSLGTMAQVKPGDKAIDFTLKNVDGSMVSLTDYNDQKGVILVFTCNPCPFAKAYEQRIIGLHNRFSSMGFPVVAVDPNDEQLSPDDTFEKMQARAKEKNYPYPYLKDETQEVYKAYGATRTPHVFLLNNTGKGFEVAYIGAIDNNAMNENAVTERYVEKAINAVIQGKKADPAKTDAIGCTIKSKG